jgi:hypothetical protein
MPKLHQSFGVGSAVAVLQHGGGAPIIAQDQLELDFLFYFGVKAGSMFLVSILLVAFCVALAVLPGELTQILLTAVWVAMGLMAMGATLYSLLSLV